MPPKHKRHDKPPDRRNETGLAAPGRKIHKQRSNGLLNATPSASVSAAVDPATCHKILIAPDHSRANEPQAPPAALASAIDTPGTSLAQHVPHDMPVLDIQDAAALDRSSDDASKLRSRAGTNDSRPDYSPSTTSTSDASSASTVIRPHSLRDVVAILLLLLQLPPHILFAVQFLYTAMTFGSFAGVGLNLSSLSAAVEWAQGRGEPPTSIISTLVCDLAFTFAWLCIPWGRNFTLDIAQIVMAISLGGGAASHGGGWTLPIFGVCLGLLVCSHALRHDAPRKHLVDLLWTIASQSNLLPPSFPMSVPELAKSAAAGHHWARAILELHIITQGITRIVRRVFTNNATASQAASAKRVDSDPQALLQVPSVGLHNDTAADGTRSFSVDGRPPGSPPVPRDAREKYVSMSKKRRKQATYVRSQQPFWAAIASTKVTVSKEMEQSQASRDSYEAGATSVSDLGGVGCSPVDDRVWIVRVEDTEIEFEACLQSQRKGKRKVQDDSESTGGADEVSGLQVRVNDADWASATFRSSRATDKMIVIKGKIHGLTALTEYEISFIRRGEEGGPVCTVALLTRQGPSDEIGSITAAQPPQLQGKLSPGSTVKQAIATAERELNETKNRSKKIRRDHKSASSALLKEVGHFKDRLQTFGGTDVRQRQREIQFRQNIRQAEDAVSDIALEIENLGPVPEEEQLTHQARKKDWESARAHRNDLRQEYDGVKAECDKRIAAVRGENQSVAQKREKLQARLQRLDGQRDELESSNVQAQEARARQARDRKALLGAREIQERNYHQQIINLEAQTSDVRFRTSQFESQLHHFEPSHAINGQVGGPQIPAPHTPESTFAALRHGPPFTSPFGQQQLHYPVGSGTPPITSRRGSLVAKTRERKSSMLSDASGFTDDALGEHASDARPGPLGYETYAAARNNSEGSGSSGSMAFVQANGYGANSGTNSGSGSGCAGSSRRDSPASPTMGAGSAARLSPIGTGLGKTKSRHAANGNGGK